MHTNRLLNIAIILSTFSLIVFTGLPCFGQTSNFASMSNKQLAQETNKEQFSFIVQGDNRPTGYGKPLPKVLFQIFDEIQILKPDFVLSVGDIGYGYGDTRQQFINELERFQSLIDKIGLPFFNAPGNHEVQDNEEALSVLLQRYKEIYGSFNYGKSHFIVLNTDELGHAGKIEGDQLTWLKEDLEKNKSAVNIFVLMHRPLYSSINPDFDPQKKTSFAARTNRDEIVELLGRYPVKMVFSGHEHLYHEEIHNGITYITSGGSGAPLYAQPQLGGFSHYVLINVDGNNVSYKVIEPNHVEVTNVSGNDGIESVSVVRVTNSNDSNLTANNIALKLPKISSNGEYKVSTKLVIRGKLIPLPAKITSITDNHDGSVTVGVTTELKPEATFSVTVEAVDNSLPMSSR